MNGGVCFPGATSFKVLAMLVCKGNLEVFLEVLHGCCLHSCNGGALSFFLALSTWGPRLLFMLRNEVCSEIMLTM